MAGVPWLLRERSCEGESASHRDPEREILRVRLGGGWGHSCIHRGKSHMHARIAREVIDPTASCYRLSPHNGECLPPLTIHSPDLHRGIHEGTQPQLTQGHP